MGCIMFIGTPRGAFTSIPYIFLELPPRVFLGILSEYYTHKYSPELVNKDFGDFLVMLYISIRIPRLHPAYPRSKSRVFFTKSLRQPQKYSQGFPKSFPELFWFTILGRLGRVYFCTQQQPVNYLIYFQDPQKKTPAFKLGFPLDIAQRVKLISLLHLKHLDFQQHQYKQFLFHYFLIML